ncbi:hypothetical protein PAPYR_6539 [Paratrimastix pyriformis]|uniref:AMP-activated protein kinase glycogen-binding domain-containing protein n=1 Tax=Paratrimastix pyriformis TaxID=342808 RepID=A0ABQ8UIV3_9EUKA|nr:hypothetical protein PAPYR_6539 [Paratrimastix pyriformis]
MARENEPLGTPIACTKQVSDSVGTATKTTTQAPPEEAASPASSSLSPLHECIRAPSQPVEVEPLISPEETFARTVLFSYGSPCDTASVVGSFDGWRSRVPLLKIADNPYTPANHPIRHTGRYALLVLPKGRYAYKFIVNGFHWVIRDDLPTERDAEGNVNNVLVI